MTLYLFKKNNLLIATLPTDVVHSLILDIERYLPMLLPSLLLGTRVITNICEVIKTTSSSTNTFPLLFCHDCVKNSRHMLFIKLYATLKLHSILKCFNKHLRKSGRRNRKMLKLCNI